MTAALLAALAAGPFARSLPDPNAPRPLFASPIAVSSSHAGAITVRGRKLDGVKQVTCDVPGVTVKLAGPGKKANPPNGTTADRAGDTEVGLIVRVPPGFRGGSVPVTLAAGKKSSVFKLPVDPPGTVADKEPNGGFANAQPVVLPATVAGVLSGDRDVDVFALTLAAGQTARVEATTHGSPADPVLTAWDADRHILAAADDRAGHRLQFTAARAGRYFLSVADANDLGGGLFGYRLRLK